MLAHLNHGRYNGYQMLDSTTIALMHSDLFTHDEKLRGFCYGFFNLSRNGYRMIGHGGATEYFFSYLKLLPADGYGIFISTNTKGGMSLVSEVTDQFIDQFFPDTSETNPTFSLSKEDLKKFTGNYIPNRRPIKRMTRIAALTNTPIKVSIANDRLVTSGENTWIPLDSTTFQSETSTTRLAFDKGQGGTIKFMYIDSSPHTVFERVDQLESIPFNIFVLTWSSGLGIIGLLWWIASYVFKKRYKVKQRNGLPVISKWLVGINSFLIAGFFILMAMVIGSTDFIFRPRNTSDYLLLTIPIIIAILSLSIIYLSLIHFFRKIKWRSRIFYLFIAIGMGMMTYMMYFWNLIGYKF